MTAQQELQELREALERWTRISLGFESDWTEGFEAAQGDIRCWLDKTPEEVKQQNRRCREDEAQ